MQGHCASEFFSEPFKSTFSVPYSSVVFLEFIYPVQYLEVEVLDVEYRPLLYQEKFYVFLRSLLLVNCHKGFVFIFIFVLV